MSKHESMAIRLQRDEKKIQTFFVFKFISAKKFFESFEKLAGNIFIVAEASKFVNIVSELFFTGSH
jgi:hypothetical protein